MESFLVENKDAFTCIASKFAADVRVLQWASCQKRKIAGCTRAGNAGNVFPATAG